MPTVQSRVVAHGPSATQRRQKAAMAGRPDSVSVRTEFLQKGLDKGPVLVSELEAAARAAGLLGSAHLSNGTTILRLDMGPAVGLHRAHDWRFGLWLRL